MNIGTNCSSFDISIVGKMQGGGRAYEYSGETTEWEDILIKKGITTKEEVLLNKGLNPFDFMKEELELPEEEPKDPYENLTVDEIDELLDDDLGDEKALDLYRQRRIAEMKQATVKNRFGDVVEIVKDEWIRQVTDGSKSSPVVIHLYQDSFVECQLVDEALRNLASRFKYIKFLRIKYNQAIENWPEKNLPTVFVYENGAMKTQIITLNKLGGKKMTTADLEWYLVENNVITDSELDENPRSAEKVSVKKAIGSSRYREYNSEDEDDD